MRLEKRSKEARWEVRWNTVWGMWIEFLLVFVLAMFSGGWATGAGIVFGIDPWLVYLAAVAGSITFTLLFLVVGRRFKNTILSRFYPDAEAKVSSSKTGDIVGK